MIKQLSSIVILVFIFACSSTQSISQKPQVNNNKQATINSIEAKTSGMKNFPGFFNFWWDDRAGKVWLEIDRFNAEFLYVNSLPAGVGSNDIGLDRGQLGSDRVVKFVRSGPKVLLVQINTKFRAISDNPAEQTSVEQANLFTVF